MISRILALPLGATAFLLIAPLEPASFHFAQITQYVAPFGETQTMALMYGSLFFCISPMLCVPESRGFENHSSFLEKILCTFAIAGAVFGSLLTTVYLLVTERVYDTLLLCASTTIGQLLMGALGTLFALSALFAGTGLLKKP